MKVLWITNALLPEAICLLGKAKEIKGTGGWVLGLANTLQSKENIELHIAAISDHVQNLATVKGASITYHAIPRGKGDTRYNKQYEEYYRGICKEIEPDVVHIHGTEFPHSLAALRACGAESTVVSIQGLVSEIAKYNRGGISIYESIKNLTFHDCIRGGIIRQQEEMRKMGEYEVQLIRESKHLIGRTSFDRQHTWVLNPQAHYYHCGEVLRSEFYGSIRWGYESCVHHRIFMSQSAFPIKGIHKVIDALDIVVKHYPDVQLRVAGQNIICPNGKFDKLFRMTSYGKYVRNKIKSKRLEDNITFVGSLNAEEMIKEMLSSNLFICSSIIENSSNSLAEAQLLGLPCICSYAGGNPDLMKGNEDNLYVFDDVEMLAYKIISLFQRTDFHEADIMREIALKRHDPISITKELASIYRKIMG